MRWGPDEPVIVLCVDDDRPMLHVFEQVITDERVQLFTAESGAEALTIMESHPADIIIADEVMPGMNGVHLLEQIFKRWPDTIRVLHTAHPWPDTVIESVNRAGVHRILVKPLELCDLRQSVYELVSDLLARRRRVASAITGPVQLRKPD